MKKIGLIETKLFYLHRIYKNGGQGGGTSAPPEPFRSVTACMGTKRKSHYNINKDIHLHTKIVSEYDQEIPQSQTADNPLAPRGRAPQPSRDTRKTN